MGNKPSEAKNKITVLDAIISRGTEGIAKSELSSLLDGKMETPRSQSHSIRRCVFFLLQEGKIREENGRLIASGNGRPVQVRPVPVPPTSVGEGKERLQRVVGTEGIDLSVYSPPLEYHEVTEVILVLESGGKVPLPTFAGNLKICTGPQIPDWNPRQVVYRGVRTIQIFSGSRPRPEVVNIEHGSPVTLAPVGN